MSNLLHLLRRSDHCSDIAQHQSEEGEEITVKVAARLATNLAYQNKDNLQAGLIIAGWDKVNGGSVWGVPLGGTMIPAPYAMGGSGSAYIYGFCDKVTNMGRT
jgi:20S proteasome subunit beta 1